MNFFTKVIAYALLSVSLLFNSVLAGVILPEPDCGLSGGKTCLVFDDFTVYSMAFLQFNEDASLKPLPGDQYYIDSSPGKISDDIVIASSPAGARDNSDISATGIDDAFNTPAAGGSDLFAMLATNEPTPLLTNDNMVTSLLPNPDDLDIDDNGDVDGDGKAGGGLSLWDIEVSKLTDFLDGEDLLFFFNLNESGANEALDAGQDMLGWMRVFLTDSNTGNSLEFTLSGNNTLFPLVQSQAQSNVDSILPTAEDEWAYIHGQICVSTVDGSVLALSSCSQAGNPTDGMTVDQNLGANAAAFGLWNDDLNSALYGGSYDMMTVDLRMSHIENGFDQLFIRAGQVGDEIPLPASIWLLLTGLACLRYSRNSMLKL